MKKNGWGSLTVLLLVSALLIAMMAALSGSPNPTLADGDERDATVAKSKTGTTHVGVPTPASGVPATLDYTMPSDAERKIIAALDSKTTIALKQVQLTEFLDHVAKKHDIPCVILSKILTNDGVDTDRLLDPNFMQIKLRHALAMTLRLYEPPLTCLIEHEVLKITTITDAEEHLQTRVYGTRHMPKIQPKYLRSVIWTATTGPWQDGPVSEGIGGTITPVPGGIVVRQTFKNHREIQELLRQLTRQQADVAQSQKWPSR